MPLGKICKGHIEGMSYDLGVWYPHKFLSDEEATDVYIRLCESDTSGVSPHPAVHAFYVELTTRYPEFEMVPEDRIDDSSYCPWSGALGKSPGHVIMSCVWSQAEAVEKFVCLLAHKHGLAVFNPQVNQIYYPTSSPFPKREMWH